MNPMNWLWLTVAVWIIAKMTVLTSLTNLQLVVAILSSWILIKFVLLSMDFEGYMKWANSFFKKNNNNKCFRFLFLAIFAGLAYLLIPKIGIVYFFASMFAGISLYAHTMMHYPKVMISYIQAFKGKNAMSQIALDWIIWLGLGAWALKELFF